MSWVSKLFHKRSEPETGWQDVDGWKVIDLRPDNEVREEESLMAIASRPPTEVRHIGARAADERIALELVDLVRQRQGAADETRIEAVRSRMRQLGQELWDRDNDMRLMKLVCFRAGALGGHSAKVYVEAVWSGIGPWRY